MRLVYPYTSQVWVRLVFITVKTKRITLVYESNHAHNYCNDYNKSTFSVRYMSNKFLYTLLHNGRLILLSCLFTHNILKHHSKRSMWLLVKVHVDYIVNCMYINGCISVTLVPQGSTMYLSMLNSPIKTPISGIPIAAKA